MRIGVGRENRCGDGEDFDDRTFDQALDHLSRMGWSRGGSYAVNPRVREGASVEEHRTDVWRMDATEEGR